MARKPKGYTKCLDLLNCGNELIAAKGKVGQRGYVQASAQKVGNLYMLSVGDSNIRTTDETQFMQDLGDFADYTSWLAIEPENEYKTNTREVEVLTLDVDLGRKKGRR